jgi:Flp pilus assembly protein TadG
MIEFALSAPLLILILLGMAEIGHGLNAYMTVIASARDAARFGAQNSDPGDANAATIVFNETARLSGTPLTSCPGGGNNCVQVTHCDSSCPGGVSATGEAIESITVRVCKTHHLITGGVKNVFTGDTLFSGTVNICSETTMREIS